MGGWRDGMMVCIGTGWDCLFVGHEGRGRGGK